MNIAGFGTHLACVNRVTALQHKSTLFTNYESLILVRNFMKGFIKFQLQLLKAILNFSCWLLIRLSCWAVSSIVCLIFVSSAGHNSRTVIRRVARRTVQRANFPEDMSEFARRDVA
jgi:hypothetical protein